jgi:hypothetical protein
MDQKTLVMLEARHQTENIVRLQIISSKTNRLPQFNFQPDCGYASKLND